MNKKRILFIQLLLLVACPIIEAWAIELKDPYIVTQNITQAPVPKDECASILCTPKVYEASAQESLDSIEEQLAEVNEEYAAVSDEIDELIDEENGKIVEAENQLDDVIEEVYVHYSHTVNGFSDLSEDERFEMVENNEVVIEWKNYINDLLLLLDQLNSRLKELVQIQEELIYQSEQIKDTATVELSNDKLDESACESYPYAVEQIDLNTINLDKSLNLTGYLAQVDKYLKQLVPTPYRKLKFKDIQKVYSDNLTEEALSQVSGDKLPVEVEENVYEEFTYAKELSLREVETLSHYGQRQYLKDNSEENYLNNYNNCLAIKEGQLEFFYTINEDAFNYIKNELVDYLNNNGFTDDESVAEVKGLHDKYQIRLVLLEADGIWQPNTSGESGYLDEYKNNLNNSESNNSGEVYSSGDLDKLKDRNRTDYKKPEKPERSSKELNLPKPESLDSKRSKKSKNSKNNKKKSNDKIKLPSTGEQRPYTILALSLLIIGLIVLLINLRMKRKKKENQDSIDLD